MSCRVRGERMENADAMTKLYWMFCDRFPKQSEEAEQQRKELSEQLEPEQRKALFRLIDLDTAHCDDTGYCCFVAGFRLAAEIAATLWKENEEGSDD